MSEDYWMDVMRGKAAPRDEEALYRDAIALIGAGVNLARTARTAAGYDEYTLRNLARIVISNWKYIDARALSSQEKTDG